jgi:hypothetical protein
MRTMKVDDLREDLLRRSYLFDDPDAYEAGVRDTLDALDDLAGGEADEPEVMVVPDSVSGARRRRAAML